MNRNGAALAAAVIIVLLLSVLAVGITSLIAIESETGISELQSRQALCIAESGLEFALVQLDSGNPIDPATEYSVGRGSFTVAYTDNGDGTETIVSSGYIPSKTTASAVRVVNITGELSAPHFHPFYQNALWSDAGITINYGNVMVRTKKGGEIYGDVYAHGNASLTNGGSVANKDLPVIDGTVRVTGTASYDPAFKKLPWRAAQNGVTPLNAPVLDSSAQAWYEANSNSIINGNVTHYGQNLDLNTAPLTMIKGNLSIGNVTIDGAGTIVATGNITITGTITYNPGNEILYGPLGLVGFGDITCSGGNISSLQVSCYAGDQFIVSPAASITMLGNVGARNGLVLAGGSVLTIQYDNRLYDNDPVDNSLPVTASRTYRWKEVYK